MVNCKTKRLEHILSRTRPRSGRLAERRTDKRLIFAGETLVHDRAVLYYTDLIGSRSLWLLRVCGRFEPVGYPLHEPEQSRAGTDRTRLAAAQEFNTPPRASRISYYCGVLDRTLFSQWSPCKGASSLNRCTPYGSKSKSAG